MKKTNTIVKTPSYQKYATKEERQNADLWAATINGKAEGLEEGREEGRVEGREEGIDERNFEIATQMINDGFDLNTISKYSKLSLDELSKIKNSISSKPRVLA